MMTTILKGRAGTLARRAALMVALFGTAGSVDAVVRSAAEARSQGHLTPAAAPGSYVAVAFLPDAGENARAWASTLVAEAPVMAGVDVVLVVPGDTPDAQALDEHTGGDAVVVFDPEGTLAGAWSVRAERPDITVVVRDGAGREVLRRSAAEGVPFESVAAAVRHDVRPKALRGFSTTNGVAAGGYDPVAWRDEQRAARGRPGLKSEFRGLSFRFETEKNQRAFAEEPQKYLPAYGGWCAVSMAEGDQVEADPENFLVRDGRVYLFYGGVWGDAKEDWLANEGELRARADRNWKRISGE